MEPLLYNKHQIFVCSVNNPILRTIKTGPDVHVYSSNQTDSRWLAGRNRPRLVYHSPRDAIALVNHSLTLRCLITGNPLPIILWQWSESDDHTRNYRTRSVGSDGQAFRDVDRVSKRAAFLQCCLQSMLLPPLQ